MTHELYKQYRPTSFKGMVGQADAIRPLAIMVKEKRVPHTLLFTGPSGCGKTTAARILKTKLNCGDNDFYEMNAADANGIDMVRGIQQRVGLAPISGDCRIWLIDECHQLTTQAQNAFLKLLEDTPEHVYFLLATTNPEKLLKTIRTRSSVVELNELSEDDVDKLVARVCKLEDIPVPCEDVTAKIAKASEGSARQALVILDGIRSIEDPEEQLNAIVRFSSEEVAIELARYLVKPGGNWKGIAAILAKVKEDPEKIRRMVLGYMTSMVLKGGKLMHRAALVIDCFSDNYFDSGRAGLVYSCYEVYHDTSDDDG